MARKPKPHTEWCRTVGIVPRGLALAAAAAGVRDVLLLSRLNAADGYTIKRLPTGERLPASLVDGDTLAGHGTVVGEPMVDPSTGLWLVTVQRHEKAAGDDYDLGGMTVADVELHPSEPVKVSPKPRTAPSWVAAAMDEYRHARAAWEAQRDDVAIGYGTENREYAVLNPPPSPFEYVKQHAAMLAAQKEEAAEHDAA